ncbi:MAG TPA: hypothetical protein VK611_25050 [Acidimicrobiales bacterium]|nr:hypothetical protein [Acidimicrobiales bacterium]
MQADYEFTQTRDAQGTIDLDEMTVKEYRNATSDEERYEIVADVITADVLSTPGAGALSRSVSFRLAAETKEA